MVPPFFGDICNNTEIYVGKHLKFIHFLEANEGASDTQVLRARGRVRGGGRGAAEPGLGGGESSGGAAGGARRARGGAAGGGGDAAHGGPRGGGGGALGLCFIVLLLI